jgi:hypothetical protein
MTQDTEASQDGVESTSDELDRAAEELMAETAAAEEQQEEAVEESEAEAVEEQQEEAVEDGAEAPADNADRSRMGRKMKTMMENMETMQAKLDALTPVQAATEDEDGGELLTRAEAREETRKTIAAMNQENEAATLKYEMAFMQHVGSMGEGDEHEAIVEEMLTNYNTKATGDPNTDVELNYAKATAAFYKSQIGKTPARTNPVKGAAPSGALGVSSTATVPKKAVAMPKLDADLQDFVNNQGMSADSVKEALG